MNNIPRFSYYGSSLNSLALPSNTTSHSTTPNPYASRSADIIESERKVAESPPANTDAIEMFRFWGINPLVAIQKKQKAIEQFRLKLGVNSNEILQESYFYSPENHTYSFVFNNTLLVNGYGTSEISAYENAMERLLERLSTHPIYYRAFLITVPYDKEDIDPTTTFTNFLISHSINEELFTTQMKPLPATDLTQTNSKKKYYCLINYNNQQVSYGVGDKWEEAQKNAFKTLLKVFYDSVEILSLEDIKELQKIAPELNSRHTTKNYRILNKTLQSSEPVNSSLIEFFNNIGLNPLIQENSKSEFFDQLLKILPEYDPKELSNLFSYSIENNGNWHCTFTLDGEIIASSEEENLPSTKKNSAKEMTSKLALQALIQHPEYYRRFLIELPSDKKIKADAYNVFRGGFYQNHIKYKLVEDFEDAELDSSKIVKDEWTCKFFIKNPSGEMIEIGKGTSGNTLQAKNNASINFFILIRSYLDQLSIADVQELSKDRKSIDKDITKTEMINLVGYSFNFLQKKLGYTFKKLDSFREAFKSHSSSDFQRLEFLGDRVLALVATEYLWQYPNVDMRDKLLSNNFLSKMMRHISLLKGFKEHLDLNEGKIYRIKVVSDIFESFMGAIYLDDPNNGLENAKKVYFQNFETFIKKETLPIFIERILLGISKNESNSRSDEDIISDDERDYISELIKFNERQGKKIKLVIQKTSQKSKPIYECSCLIDGIKVISKTNSNADLAAVSLAKSVLMGSSIGKTKNKSNKNAGKTVLNNPKDSPIELYVHQFIDEIFNNVINNNLEIKDQNTFHQEQEVKETYQLDPKLLSNQPFIQLYKKAQQGNMDWVKEFEQRVEQKYQKEVIYIIEHIDNVYKISVSLLLGKGSGTTGHLAYENAVSNTLHSYFKVSPAIINQSSDDLEELLETQSCQKFQKNTTLDMFKEDKGNGNFHFTSFINLKLFSTTRRSGRSNFRNPVEGVSIKYLCDELLKKSNIDDISLIELTKSSNPKIDPLISTHLRQIGDKLQDWEMNIERKLKKTGLFFKDKDIMRSTFLHKSFYNQFKIDNIQDLFKLGSSLFELYLTHYLYDQFPNEREGTLTNMRAQMDKERLMASWMKRLDLEDLLLRDYWVNTTEDLLNADLFKSLLGGIYKDQGSEASRSFLFSQFRNDLELNFTLQNNFKLTKKTNQNQQ